MSSICVSAVLHKTQATEACWCIDWSGMGSADSLNNAMLKHLSTQCRSSDVSSWWVMRVIDCHAKFQNIIVFSLSAFNTCILFDNVSCEVDPEVKCWVIDAVRCWRYWDVRRHVNFEEQCSFNCMFRAARHEVSITGYEELSARYELLKRQPLGRLCPLFMKDKHSVQPGVSAFVTTNAHHQEPWPTVNYKPALFLFGH